MTTRLDRQEHPLPAVQPGQRRRRGQPRADGAGYKTGVPLGGGLGARQLARHPRALHPPLDRGRSRSTARRSTTETMIFPRYHQLDAVRKLEAAARAEGPGHNYLVQHSAGSGKRNTIAWLAHRLAELHDANDEQRLRQGHRRHRPRACSTSSSRTRSTSSSTSRRGRRGSTRTRPSSRRRWRRARPIIITTLQKFPFVAAEDRRAARTGAYAVIIDEAHSSQSGETASKLKEVLAASATWRPAAAAEDGRGRGGPAEDVHRRR